MTCCVACCRSCAARWRHCRSSSPACGRRRGPGVGRCARLRLPTGREARTETGRECRGPLRVRSGAQHDRVPLPPGRRHRDGDFPALHREPRLAGQRRTGAAARLEVGVEVGTLDTKDKDRDDTLRGADLFDVGRFRRRASSPRASRRRRRPPEGSSRRARCPDPRSCAYPATLPLTLSLATESGRRVATLRGETTLCRLE